MTPHAQELLGKVDISTLTTCLFRRGFRNVWLRGLTPVGGASTRMVGAATTLRFVPAREDVGGMASYAKANLHQLAFEECPEGAVLVMDTGQCRTACCCGDLLIARIQARGAAGIVTDGGFRDGGAIASLGFPAYQVQSVPSPSFLSLQAADHNVPIGCAGVAVYPGDIMVGDGEGVVVIPSALADEIAEEAWWMKRYDAFAAAELKTGRSIIGLYPVTDASRSEFEKRNQSDE